MAAREKGHKSLAFTINTAAVASERFDNETVVINFERGTYFSLTGSAPVIWAALAQPATIASVRDALVGMTGEPEGEVDAAIAAMVETLMAEGCLTEVADADAVPVMLALDAPYARPDVQAFHDLQELIAIDPVHEADAFDGWPHRPPALTLG